MGQIWEGEGGQWTCESGQIVLNRAVLVGGAGTHHFCGGLGVVRRHVLLQGHLCVAHPATVGAGEGLGLLHREGLTPVVQVWGEKWGGWVSRRGASPGPCWDREERWNAPQLNGAKTAGPPVTEIKWTYS